MTVVVVRRRAPVDEVDERNNPLSVLRPHEPRRTLVGQVVMPRRDPRVDDPDANPGSGITVRLLHGAGTDRDRHAVHLARGWTVVDDAVHAGVVSKLLELSVGEQHDLAVD